MTSRRRNELNRRHGQAARLELASRYDRVAAQVARTKNARERAKLIEEVQFLADLIELK
ncbi:hypothetical protein [Rhodoplanes elegans]|uniref:hypothetical protein n=1 Tax=Rhodoplanes elegans TaxID=29408 RepID=UPI001475B38E|nr:hypothetical protein [Rhodoplanes elegans]